MSPRPRLFPHLGWWCKVIFMSNTAAVEIEVVSSWGIAKNQALKLSNLAVIGDRYLKKVLINLTLPTGG